ncbi:DUF5986 family protein [Enterococcus faecalis]
MEENLKVAIVEQIYHGYENELKEIVNKYNIDYKSRNLNFGKLKRADNLKKIIDTQLAERFQFINKRSVIFIDKMEKVMYAFMSEDNKNQLMRKFHKERGLTYLTSVILLKNPSPEEEHDKYGQLFDPTEYTIDRFSSDLYGEASEKANKILEQFGEYIEKVCIITRDNSIGDTPKITMYELSDGCEILYSEDWSKFIPSDYIIAASDSEIEGNGRAELKNRKNKHVKLKGRKRKAE